jgi:hypothetical protein
MGRMGLRRDNDGPPSERASVFVYVLAGGLVLLLLSLSVLYFSYETRCRSHIREVRVHLEALRRSVKEFADLNGHQPKSLDELRRFYKDHGSHFWERMYVDLTSGKQEEVPEYRELNDKGGYFYEPTTGEVRLNLTRPVREYLRLYRGSCEEQTPSHW